ncbi:hypothetical protein JOQ06_005599, partial [Pogonophryne albipinna]
SQLDAMSLHRLHATAMSSSSGHGKREEKGEMRGEMRGEVRQHQRARRASSDDNSWSKTPVAENRISTIPELTESFERRLQLRDTRSEANPADEDRLCPICEEETLQSGVKQLLCAHRGNKEEAACRVRKPSEERRRSEDGLIPSEREQHTPCRKLQQPGETSSSQGRPPAARRDLQLPGETSSSQVRPPAARRDLQLSGETSSSQARPPAARRDLQQPGETSSSQGRPPAARRDLQQPGETSSSQARPPAARGDLQQPGETSSSQARPPAARGDLQQPGETSSSQGRPPAARGDLQQPGETSSSQGRPPAARGDLQQPGETSSSQARPPAARRDLQQPGETSSSQVSMGSFKGHALPGSFFLLAGVWWTVKHSLCFSSRRNKSLRTSSRAAQRRLEVIEGSAVLLCSVVGMLLEQFAAQGPALQLFDSSQHRWMSLMNWQHSTMYLFFSLWAAVALVVQSSEAAPLALDRLMLAVAFFNEAYRQSHRSAHGSFNSVCSCLQIGFVLYSPHGQVWDQSDHNNVMFVTMCFSWHLAVAMVIVSGIYAAVTWVVRSRLRRIPPMEMGLLKPRDREPESEDEVL